MRLVTRLLQGREHALGSDLLTHRKLTCTTPEPLDEHIAVADVPENARDPAELVAQSLRPVAVEKRAERAQVGTQPPCRDACLMDAFGIDVDPDDGVVQDQANHGEGDRALHDSAGRRIGTEVCDRDLGKQRTGRRERADVLRGLVGRPRAGKPEPFHKRVEEPWGHLVADLDLELTERGRAATVDHRDGVVDYAGDQSPVRVVQPGSASDRRHPDAPWTSS